MSTKRGSHLRIVASTSVQPFRRAPLTRTGAFLHHLEMLMILSRENPARAQSVIEMTQKLVDRERRRHPRQQSKA
jgi:hypothetical protein